MPTKIDVNKVTWDEPINTSKVKWDDEQPTLVDKAKGVGKKVFDELAGVGETIRSVVNTVGTLPMDVGNFAGAVVDSIVQEDLSRENFDKNMMRRAETTEPIRNALNPRPIYESGKRMVEGLEGSIAAPGQLIHEATYGGLSEQGYFPDGTPMPKELSVPKNVAAQIAGPASVIADVVPFVAIERGIPAMKPSTYAPKPGTPRGIGENTTPSNFQMREGGAVERPVRPIRQEPSPVVEPRRLMLPEPERIAQRRADIEAAIKTDEALLAREMAYGKEQSATQPNLFDTREQLPPNLEADYLNQARGDRLQAIKDAFERGDSELARLMAEGRTRPFDIVGDSPVQVDRPYIPDFRMVARTPDEVIPPSREVVPPREPATLDAVWSEAGPKQITGNDTRTPRMNTWDADSVALADEIANARGERAESIRNEQLGRFQHDDLVNAAVTPSDSLQAVGTVKPVVKGTVEQVVDMARRGEINSKEYETVYPNGARSPESPAYVIHKPSAGKNLAKIRSDLAKGKEAEHLGYPDREGVPAADLTTKAVTKDNQIISDPLEIKAEAEAGNVKWSAEGREAEVTAKAEEIASQTKGTVYKSSEGSLAKDVTVDGKVFPVDAAIADNVQAINDSGFKTAQSMSGIRDDYVHAPDRYSSDGYISFYERDITPEQKAKIKEAAEKSGLAFEEGYTFFDDSVAVRSGIYRSGKTAHDLLLEASQQARDEMGITKTRAKQNPVGNKKNIGVPDVDTKTFLEYISRRDEILKQLKEENGGPISDAEIKSRWDNFTKELTANTDSLTRKGDGIPQEVKTPQKGFSEAKTSNLEASDTIPKPKMEAQKHTIIRSELYNVIYKEGPNGWSARPEGTGSTYYALGKTKNEAYANMEAKINPPKADGITELHAGIHPKEILRGVDEGIQFARNLGSKLAPENMKTTLRKIFEFPQFAAENIPGFKPIYEFYRERTANRESIAYDVFGEDVKPMHELHRKLTREERKDYSDIIQTQDIERRSFTADELRNGQNPMGRPVSENVIQLHTMNERVMQRLADTLINKTKELIFKGYESEPWYRELRDLVDNKVTSELYKQSQYADKNIASALADVEKALAKHEELARRIQENPGYMFRDRPYGEQHVRIFKVDEFGDMQEVYMKLHKNKLGAEWSANKIRKALNPDGTVKDPAVLKQFIPKNYEEGATYKVPEVDFNKSVPEEILVYSGTQSAKSSVLNKVIENVISEGKVDKAEARNIANAVLQELTDVYKSRGFGRRFMGRKENLVEGYDTSNYVNTVTSNIGSMAGWLAKAEYAIKSMQALKDVPPEYQTYANDFIRNTLRNTNPTASKIGSTLRTALALKTLAFKTISPLINGTQNWTLGVGEYNMRIRNMGLKEDGTAQMFKAQKDVVAQAIAERTGKSHLSPYEMQAIEEFSRAGGLKAQGVRETAGLTDVGLSRGLQQATQVGMTPFSWIESVFNREAAFLSMFRKMSESGRPYEVAFKEASDFANTVHFDMSQHNLPITFQNEVGRTALSLQRYSGMYLNWAFNRAVMQNEYRPVVRSLITVAAMGGLSAVGLNQLDGVMARYLGMSPKLFVRKYVLQQSKDKGFSDDAAEKLSMFVEKGLPTLANVDISKNVEVQAPFLSVVLSGDAETAGEAVSGAWAGAARNISSGVKALHQGQYLRAAESLSPVDAFGNILKAYRMYNKGVTSLSGEPVMDRDGKKLKLTESEAVMKALGIQSLRVNDRYDIQTMSKRLEEYYQKEKAHINTLIRTAETPEEKEEARRMKRELNKEIRQYEGLIPRMGRLRNNSRNKAWRLRRFEQSIYDGGD